MVYYMKMKSLTRVIVPLVLLAVSLFCVPDQAKGCTLWAVAGSSVKDRGTLMAKNRDNTSNLRTRLQYREPGRGFRFVALFDLEEGGYVVSGINEMGLAVTNAAAGSVPRKKRDVAKGDLTEAILTGYGSVDSVLADSGAFEASHPAFYMLADAAKMALIEIAPGGRVFKTVREKGSLTHTNHYIHREFLKANEQTSKSSEARLRRINHLLKKRRSPLAIDDFIAMSDDRHGSPHNSIWRTGTPDRKVRTLGTFIVSIPRAGSPELFVRTVNEGDEKEVYRLTLDSSFWTFAGNLLPGGTAPWGSPLFNVSSLPALPEE
jgi:isopenicillin-N N-acyltransferase like protein